MQKFSKWLIKEAISATAVDSVNKIVKSFLAKKLKSKVYAYPAVEQFANSTGRGYGVRYFYGGDKSIRFNWKGANINAFTLDSVDLWDGTSHDPNWHMEFDSQQSLVKTLPLIIDFIMSPFGAGSFYLIPDDGKSSIKEEYLFEAAQNIDAFDFVMQKLVPDAEISTTALTAEYGSYKPYPVFKAIKDLYPSLFQKRGTKQVFIGTAADVSKIKGEKDGIIGSLGGVKITVSKGGKKETYAPNDQEAEIETKGIEKVAYEEQLKHLSILMKMIIKGATNALFVAGRGGTGKTQTVEMELAKAGLQDGNGYYKNTGSASPIGIYTSLYDNRDGIVLFDDCDSALADQEGRNLIKAATDTKKIRKVAWNKKSSVIVPKDQFEDAGSEGGPPTNKNGDPLYPNSFEFTGRVIFISNLKLDKLDPDGAIRTRGFIIEIDPTDSEMIDYMAKIAPNIRLEGGSTLKQSEIDDVIDEIRKSPKKSDISLRKLVRGLNVKAEMGDDPMWKTILKLYA